MNVGPKGLELIKQFEGFMSEPYLCPAGIPSIGYGCTTYNDGTKVTLDDASISIDEATDMLQYQCDTVYGKCVDDNITSKTTQEMFDAMTSFTWNLGCGNFSTSTLLKRHNESRYDETGDEFLKWVYSNGEYMQGLMNRREAERELYLS